MGAGVCSCLLVDILTWTFVQVTNMQVAGLVFPVDKVVINKIHQLTAEGETSVHGVQQLVEQFVMHELPLAQHTSLLNRHFHSTRNYVSNHMSAA